MPVPMGVRAARARIRARMTETLTWERATGRDAYARPTYAAGQVVPCMIQERNQLVRTRDGQEHASRATIWVPANSGVNLGDRITLPDGTRPLILDVQHIPFAENPVYDVIVT